MKVRPLDLQESQDATGDYKHTTKGANNQQPHEQCSIPAISVIRAPVSPPHLLHPGLSRYGSRIYCSDIPG